MLIKRVVAKAGDFVEVLSFTFKMICKPYQIVGRTIYYVSIKDVVTFFVIFFSMKISPPI